MSHEPAIRLGAFVGVAGLCLAWEALAPRLVRRLPWWHRWPTNLGLSVLGLILVRFTVGALALGAAGWAQTHGWGVFNSLKLHPIAGGILAFFLLDLGIYGQHVATHALPALWRLHRVHHADLDMDVSTAVRFHPLELLLSMAYKAALVLLLGAAPLAVLAFELTLSLGALFTHANGRMAEGWDRTLRWVFVTPEMHAIHHSDRPPEANSNFGFSFSWWDRIFRTYRPKPESGLVIGVRGVPGLGLGGLLVWPALDRPRSSIKR